MVKSLLLCSLLPALLLALALAGCSNPESHPIQAPPQFVDGDPLDVNASVIGDNGGRPWIVQSDWVIPEGSVVQVQAGATILFDSLWWVDVRGKIEAVGTAERPILFSTAYREPEMGQWRGFKLRNTTDGSRFEHCIFTYGAFFDPDTSRPDPVEPTVKESLVFRGMLGIRNSSPVIERCVVFRNQNNAVYISGANSHPRIRFNVFYKNDASAVRASLGDVDLNAVDISYNNATDNSSPSFIVADSSDENYYRFGVVQRININLDSCDYFYNLVTYQPLMTDPYSGDFTLMSCSPNIDAGPYETATYDGDNTRADMAATNYVQVPGELRGLIDGTLDAATEYRLSCNVRVDAGHTLTIPAGTRIFMTGLYQIELHGRIVIDGTAQNPVRFAQAVGAAGDMWGGLVFFDVPDSVSAPSIVRGANFEHFQKFDVRRDGVEFTDCRFSDGHDYGVAIATADLDTAHAVRVTGCTFERMGEFGISVDSSSARIRNCLVAVSQGRGVTMRWTDSSVVVANTIVRNARTTGLYAEDFCAPRIHNCVFTGNDYFGIQLLNNCNAEIRNTIVHANARYGIYAQRSSQPVLAYNDVFGHSFNSSVTNYVPASLPIAGSLSQDPLFTADLHLGTGSPCINAGDPDPAFNDVDGSPNDMGAFGGPLGGSVGVAAGGAAAARLVNR